MARSCQGGTRTKDNTVFTPPKSSSGFSCTGSLKHLCLKTALISALDLVYFLKECENKLQKTNPISHEQREQPGSLRRIMLDIFKRKLVLFC